jgi:RNA polymerase sigma-70 factor (ECF subfamily)
MTNTNTLPGGPRTVPPDDEEFVRLTVPYRREPLVHCYRMLGSLHDVEDLVQETYLRAWRAYDRFEGRSTLRMWLYRIATGACLTALEHRSRRMLPAGLGAPSADPERRLPAAGVSEGVWVQPLPDSPANGPAAIVASRESVRPAFIAALQHLPARQRAVRLRDPRRRVLLDRYTAAFETAGVPELLRLLRDDVVLEMPPHSIWFSGRAAVIRFLAAQVLDPTGRRFTFVPTGANGQAAAVGHVLGADGLRHAHALQVLTLRATGISRIVSFNDPALFPGFASPAVQPLPARADRAEA